MKDVSIGFLMTLAEDEQAMRSFATLPEEKRNEIIARASHASSREEMQSIVHDVRQQ